MRTVLSVGGAAQVETDLPPQVEATVHTQPCSGATRVHLVYSSEHQDRSFQPATPFSNCALTVRVGRQISSVWSAALEKAPEFEQADVRVKVASPSLELHNVVVLR